MLTRRRRITPTVSFTRKLHLSHLNQILESSEVLFQGLLRTKTTDAAWRPLSCILYLLYFTISFPPHIWQNWSALSSSTLKCFLPTQKKKHFSAFTGAQPSHPQTFKATCWFVPYSCCCHGNSCKQPRPACGPQHGADSNIRTSCY